MPLHKIDDWFGKIQDALLTILLVAMIVLAFTQVILRNFFNTGLSWADPLVRHLVLWVGFIGASVATKEHGHLAIDLLSRLMPEKLKRLATIFVHGASAIVCALLAYASYKFVSGEREAGTLLFTGVPTYVAVVVIPIGFFIMSIRFTVRLLSDVRGLRGTP